VFVKRISGDELAIGAPAKVNLYLRVLGKRPDGYHDIDSLFQAVSLFDRLRFKRRPGRPGVSMRLLNRVNLPTGPDNLIARAYQLMRSEFGLTDGLEVELEKNIPIASGLAGGSSDGAAAILACRELFGLKLSYSEMGTISLSIGSDLPFFFSHGQAHVTGRGDKVREVRCPVDYWIVLISPNVEVSTAESYARLRIPLTKSRSPFSLRRWKTPKGLVGFLRKTENDFERIQLGLFPDLEKIKAGLMDNGAMLARLSGSGPTIFGIYEEAPELGGGRLLGRNDWTEWAVRPVILPGQNA
jgi:4-diphosphocytidyl-2-C-methyl-D-erythritol kinase